MHGRHTRRTQHTRHARQTCGVQREGASEDDLDPTVNLNNTGAQLTATPTNSGLTICFTRTLAELGGAQIPIRLDGMPLTFAACECM